MLILSTPLPPAETGTAPYAAALLDDLAERWGIDRAVSAVRIAVDTDRPDQRPGAIDVGPWTVVDHRSLAPGDGDVCVYFLASNPYHGYVYEALARHGRGRSVAVIHDLTASFFVRDLARRPGSAYAGLVPRALTRGLGAADAAERTYRQLPDIARISVAGQGVTLDRADLIVTHSWYAKARLVLDYALTPEEEARIAVCRMPVRVPDVGPLADAAAGGLFEVGSLGFHSPRKRLPSVVRAWDAFLARSGAADRAVLHLGGTIPDAVRDELMASCGPAARATIRTTGYLDETAYHALMRRLDLLVALRFPTAGETSALVAHAVAHDTPVVVSDYAAFREDAAVARIPVDPDGEATALQTALEDAFALWSAGTRGRNVAPAAFARKRDLAATLIAETERPS